MHSKFSKSQIQLYRTLLFVDIGSISG